jgi:hypothetical protein
MKASQIKSTTNYAIFAEDSYNRCVRSNPGLLASMKEYGWIDAFPMMVVSRGNQLVVKDGQHRLEYAKKLKLPVKYVLVDEDGLQASRTSVGLPWSLKDYAASYAKRGNKQYERLLSFRDETGLSVGLCADLLSGKAGVNGSSKSVKDGTFKVSHEDSARQVVSVIHTAQQVVKWGAHHRFVCAIAQCVIHAKINVGTLCDKIRTNPGKLVLQPTTTDFINLIESVYNYRNHNSLPIAHKVKTAMTRKHNGKDIIAS